MKKFRLAISIVAALMIGACGTSDKVTEAMLAAHAVQQAQPTLSLKCPAGGCEMSYTDPRDRQQFKTPTNGWDAILGIGQTTVGLVQASVVPLALGTVAVKGMQQMAGTKGPNVTTTTTNTGPVTTNTRGDVTANRTETTTGATTTTTVGSNSGANSGNSGRIAGTTMSDATSTPTIVNQPAPTVVTQPAPVVVTQPAPVVVTQPSPVVVQQPAPAASGAVAGG